MNKHCQLLTLILLLMMGVCDGWAANWIYGYTVYFKKPANWTAAYVCIGNATESDAYPMTQEGNSDVWSCTRTESSWMSADAWYIADAATSPTHRTADLSVNIDCPVMVVPTSTGGDQSRNVVLAPVVKMGHQWDAASTWVEEVMTPFLNEGETAVAGYTLSQSLAAATSYLPAGLGFKIRVNDDTYGSDKTITFYNSTDVALEKEDLVTPGYGYVSRVGITTLDARDYEFRVTLAAANQPLVSVTNYPAYKLTKKINDDVDEFLGYFDSMTALMEASPDKVELTVELLRDVTDTPFTIDSNKEFIFKSNHTMTIVGGNVYVFSPLTLEGGTYRVIPATDKPWHDFHFFSMSPFTPYWSKMHVNLKGCCIDASAVPANAIGVYLLNDYRVYLSISDNATIIGGSGKYGIQLVHDGKLELNSCTLSGGAGALLMTENTPVSSALDTHGDHAYYEADGTQLYSGWYGDNSISRKVVVKAGARPNQNFKLEYHTAAGNDTLICCEGLGYATLIGEQNSPATISLLKDASYPQPIQVPAGKEFTFAGNGHTLTMESYFQVYGKLTLRNGTYRAKSGFSDQQLVKVQGGELRMEGGVLDAANAERALLGTTQTDNIVLSGGKLIGRDGAIWLPEGRSVASILAPNKGYYSEVNSEWSWCGDLTDNSISHTVQIDDVYRLTVGDKCWASLYLPYNARVPEGATAYYIPSGEVTDNVLTMTALQAGEVIPAGNGVFVRALSGSYGWGKVQSDPAAITNIVTGVTEATACEANANYVLNLAQSSASQMTLGLYTGTTLGANKAYIPASALTGVQAGVPLRVVAEGQVVTEIEAVTDTESAPRKILENGHIRIVRGDRTYDMNGRIVK